MFTQKICQELFCLRNGPFCLCPFQTPHLHRPEISTGFISNVNNALKVSDRLEKALKVGSVSINQLQSRAIHET